MCANLMLTREKVADLLSHRSAWPIPSGYQGLSPPTLYPLNLPPHPQPPPQNAVPNLSRFSRFLRPGEPWIHLLGVNTRIGPPGPLASVRGWRGEGKRTAAAMDADSARVGPGRKRFPTSRLRSAPAAPLEPTKRGAGPTLSGAGAARGAGSPRPGTRPRDPGTQRRGRWGGEKSDYCTERGTSIRTTSAWRPALPGIPPNSRNPKIRKFRKRNCKRVSRSLGTVSQASRRLSALRTPQMPSRPSAPGGGDRCARPPSASPGHLPRFFTRKGPQPRPATPAPARVPGRWSAGLLPRLPPPAPSYKKGKLGPCENPEECSL